MVHVCKTSSVPDHCRQYALSDPLDRDYQSICNDHTHQDICDRCKDMTTVLQGIEEAIRKMPTHSVSEDTTQELLFVFDQTKNNILAWKAHLLQVDMQHVLSNLEIMRIKNKPPPFSYLLSDQEPTIKVNTVFENVPLGSPLAYQLHDFGRPKFLFNRVRSEPLAATATCCTSFPDLPFFPNSQAVQLFNTNELRSMTNLDFDTSRDFFQLNLSLDIAEAQALEKRTVLQGESKEWLEQHKIRLTASSFGKVFHRVHRPSEAMVKSLFANKDLSKVRAIAHGKAKERVARSIFARNMQKVTKTFTVFDAGLCLNPSLPYLGASPDGKIYDPLADPCYGLLEIKCPFSKRADTLEQASADPTFYLEQIGDSFYLKRGHSSAYYEQVQGQLAITGMKWCNFCIFLSETNKMWVYRIPFDDIYCLTQLLPKLKEFYLDYALKYLVEDFHANN